MYTYGMKHVTTTYSIHPTTYKITHKRVRAIVGTCKIRYKFGPRKKKNSALFFHTVLACVRKRSNRWRRGVKRNFRIGAQFPVFWLGTAPRGRREGMEGEKEGKVMEREDDGVAEVSYETGLSVK